MYSIANALFYNKKVLLVNYFLQDFFTKFYDRIDFATYRATNMRPFPIEFRRKWDVSIYYY